MKFTEPAHEGEFLKRYKRFFADVRLPDEVVVAHVPNTGSLKTCLFEGAPCVVLKSNNPARKLKATLQFIKTPTGWVGVNTSLPNELAAEAFTTKLLWSEFDSLQREVKISAESRIDLVLSRGSHRHHVEIKNVTYAENGVAYFPDAVTTRGQKHLRELMRLQSEGHGAELLFVVQREDCAEFAPADHIDPEYGRLLREAHSAGIVIRALTCAIDPLNEITLTNRELKLRI